jgi:tetratricopeptide (TPR) repeat protein
MQGHLFFRVRRGQGAADLYVLAGTGPREVLMHVDAETPADAKDALVRTIAERNLGIGLDDVAAVETDVARACDADDPELAVRAPTDAEQRTIRAVERSIAGVDVPEDEHAVGGAIYVDHLRRLRAAAGLSDVAIGEGLFAARHDGFPIEGPARALLLQVSWLAFRFARERSVLNAVGVPAIVTLLREGKMSFDEALAGLGLDGCDADMIGELLRASDEVLLRELEDAEETERAREGARAEAVDAIVARVAERPEVAARLADPPLAPKAVERTKEDELIDEAKSALQNGYTSRGRAGFERVLRGSPDHVGARIGLAESLAQEDPARACSLVEGLSDAPAVFLFGSCLLAQGRHEEAATAFRRSLRAPQEDAAQRATAYLYLSQVLFALNQPAEAWRSAQLAVAHLPGPAARAQLGLAARTAGDPARAHLEHDRLLRADPESDANLAGRTMARLALGDVDGALEDVERWVALAAGRADEVYARTARARVWLAAGHYEGAATEATVVLRAVPDDMVALGLRARAYALLGRAEQAVRDLRSLRATAAWRRPGKKDDTAPLADDAEACALLASCLLLGASERAERGDEKGAESRVDEALALAGDCGDRGDAVRAGALRERARLLRGGGHFAREAEVLAELVALTPEAPDAHLARAIALHRGGALDAALEATDRALAALPDHANLHYERACVLTALGRAAEALDAVAAAVAHGAAREDIAADDDLVPLHADARFASILESSS